MIQKRTYGLFLFFLMLINGYTQDFNYPNNQDFETWSAGKIRYILSEKLRVDIGGQFRMKENSTTFDRIFTQIEGRYLISDKKSFDQHILTIGTRYLFMNDNVGNTEFENHIRFHIDYNYKIDSNPKDPFSSNYRIRYQIRNELGRTKDEGDYNSHDIRFRWKGRYNIKSWKLDPEIFFETFHHYQTGALNGFTKYRMGIGTSYKFNKEQRISICYIKEKERSYWNPKKIRIIRITYMHTIRKNTDKKEEL